MAPKKRVVDDDNDEEQEEEEEEEEVMDRRKSTRKRTRREDDEDEEEYSNNKKKTSSSSNGGGETLMHERKSAVSDLYSDIHRLLLQAVLRYKVLKDSEFKKLLTKLKNENSSVYQSNKKLAAHLEKFEDVVKELNNALSSLHMRIKNRRMLEYGEGELYWGLVNLRNDKVSSVSSPLEMWELTLFKEILKLITQDEKGVTSDNEAINTYNALTETSKLPKKKSTELSTCVAKLVKMGWLHRFENNDGTNPITLGPRAMMELGDVLSASMGEGSSAYECPISKQIVIKTEKYNQWYVSAGGKPSSSSSSNPKV